MSGWLPDTGVAQWLDYLARYAAQDLSGFLSICKLLIVNASLLCLIIYSYN